MSDTSDLLARLRFVEGGNGETHWYRNPDGPDAARLIEAQAAEIERLRGALGLIAITYDRNQARKIARQTVTSEATSHDR